MGGLSDDRTRHPTPANVGEINFVFPTVYPLKVAGKNDVALESTVVEMCVAM